MTKQEINKLQRLETEAWNEMASLDTQNYLYTREHNEVNKDLSSSLEKAINRWGGIHEAMFILGIKPNEKLEHKLSLRVIEEEPIQL